MNGFLLSMILAHLLAPTVRAVSKQMSSYQMFRSVLHFLALHPLSLHAAGIKNAGAAITKPAGKAKKNAKASAAKSTLDATAKHFDGLAPGLLLKHKTRLPLAFAVATSASPDPSLSLLDTFCRAFEVVILDPSGSFNMAARVSRSAYQEVRMEVWYSSHMWLRRCVCASAPSLLHQLRVLTARCVTCRRCYR